MKADTSNTETIIESEECDNKMETILKNKSNYQKLNTDLSDLYAAN